MRNKQLRSAKVLPRFALALAIAASGSACTTTDKTKVYQGEEFHGAGMYSHQFPGNAVATCEAARRALLSQGYVVADIKADTVNGQKSFQPDSDTHVEISFHVVCVSDDAKGMSSTAFVNALQDRYAIKKTPSSASLGVGAVGAVSLPFGSSDDSLVKIASETIPPGPIYDRFFTLTGQYLTKIGVDFGPEPKHEPTKVEVEVPKRVEHDDAKAPDSGHAGPLKAPTPEGAAPDKSGPTDPAAAPAGAAPATSAATPGSPGVAPIVVPSAAAGAVPNAVQSVAPAGAPATPVDKTTSPDFFSPAGAAGLIDS